MLACVTVMWASERTLRRTFDDSDLAVANARALALHSALAPFRAEVEDLIPGARSLTVVLRPGSEPSASLARMLESEIEPSRREPGTIHEFPVVYDGEDIGSVAERSGIGPDDVGRLHAEAAYTVAFIGFAPGFPYLLGLPRSLAIPRRATPRARVPAGSVAIAGAFSGIYPRATPGGWNLIGHTDAVLFDPARGATLQPGDRVRFVPA